MPKVGGILDPYGGLRVIIGTDSEMRAATRCDELCFVVEGMEESDPPEWNRVPYIVKMVERHIAWWIETRNDPSILDWLQIKLYQIRCRKTDKKRATNLEYIVMG